MTERLTPDLCVIGAGAGGLSVAAAAAALGVPVVLIEKGRMGGAYLTAGGLASAALIAAAGRAEAIRTSAAFGIKAAKPGVEFYKVNDHVQEVIAGVAPNVSKERMAGLGVQVIEGEGRFQDAETVVVGDRFEIKARRFVVATGSVPAIPAIPGLAETPYLTGETIFEARERPKHLIVAGGGSRALELAQAFRRLGSDVTVLDVAQPLSGEDPECAAVVLDALAREGVVLRSGAGISRVKRVRARIEAVLEGGEVIEGSDLLIEDARRSAIDGLGLAAAGIEHNASGIVVDGSLRTTNKRVYAIGDACAGQPRLTQAATYHAELVIRHALFRMRVKADSNVIPRVTYTSPELAHVGLTETAARAERRTIRVLRWPCHENDRARAGRETAGHIKVIADGKGKVLGATIVGAAAGEMIATWALAVSQGLNIRAFAGIVVPYPALSEIGRRAAMSFFTPRLSGPFVRSVTGFLQRFG